MPRNKRRKSHSFDELPWKKVDVGLGSSDQQQQQFPQEDNHYDGSSSLVAAAAVDLEASPQEDMAMFFGLEVLKPGDYQVSKERQLTIRNKDIAVSYGSDLADGTKEARKGRPKVISGEDQSQEKDSNVNTSKKSKKWSQAKGATEQAVSSKKKSAKQTDGKSCIGGDGSSESFSSAGRDTGFKGSSQQLLSLQLSWMTATGGVMLHDRICRALLSQSFWTPTPIQQYSLAPAILGRRNIVGAAATGSGKTFAYLLPILQYLMERPEMCGSEANELPLQALIMTPTRELALQVSQECEKLNIVDNKRHRKICGVIVGGLAHVKQKRILDQHRPPILVATPGRLWEMMSTRENIHLIQMSQLRFLVIDEADRMIQQGNFRELVRIFDEIHRMNPMDNDDEGGEVIDEDDEDMTRSSGRLRGLPGVPGESKVHMLDDVLKQMQDRRHLDDEECEHRYSEQEEPMSSDSEEDAFSLPATPPVQRQTFVFSATLTLPPMVSRVASAKVNNKKKVGNKMKTTVEGAIAEILEKSRAHGPTKVVDLTSGKKDSKGVVGRSDEARVTSSSRLPDGLSLFKIDCTKRHKDSHLYAYLVTTARGASGPCLVFCNSIAAVHRVSMTLRTLRLPVRALHANMPQKARFKAVESLRDPNSRSVVVCSDVASRGLNIPSVATVIHYDAARQVDTFIHRAGRTARGVGESAVGSSLSLISPDEDRVHDKVCAALETKRLFQSVPMDARLFAAAQERTNLASKIVACDQQEMKTQKNNEWFHQAAEEAGLDLDADLIDDGLAGGDRREQQQLREAHSAKVQLRELLAQPMKTQRFRKFLSNNPTAATTPETDLILVSASPTRSKKRKRSGKK